MWRGNDSSEEGKWEEEKNIEAEQTYDSPQKHTVVEGWNEEEDVIKTRNKEKNMITA